MATSQLCTGCNPVVISIDLYLQKKWFDPFSDSKPQHHLLLSQILYTSGGTAIVSTYDTSLRCLYTSLVTTSEC